MSNKDHQACKHERVIPKFDKEAAKGLSSAEVKARWPRFCGVCPDCKANVIVYASYEHYISGDW